MWRVWIPGFFFKYNQGIMVTVQKVEIRVPAAPELIKITGQAERVVQSHGFQEGLLNIWISGDSVALLCLPCPAGQTDAHRSVYQDLEHLSSSALKAASLGQSLSLPIVRGQLPLDTWQELLLVSFHAEPLWHHLTFQMLGDT